ncbi:hypothetical protein A9Q87_06325 [Flavobacteriales bacterium 34_180_T64]|nr:hypothetical protein A9Q87_06325 [Flavobacteriales bacterium 34_180_T64]
MAPINFEENIKDKLEKRTLQPSVESWSKLENRLDIQGKKRNNKRYLWIGAAASMVGIILVTSQLFKTNEIEQQTMEIVNADAEINTDKPEIQEEDLTLSETQFTTVTSENRTDVEQIKTDIKTEDDSHYNEDAIVNNQSNSTKEYAQMNPGKTKEKTKVESAIFEELSPEQLKLNEVVAQIKMMSEDGKSVTEEDIDALLQQAEREIIANKIYKENTKVVDASALLQVVETDLDQSFRDKVFKTLKSSYYTVKTAVTDRNN